MKHFLFVTALILLPVAVNARQIVPTMYAQKYCELRGLGVTLEEAVKAAVAYAYIGDGQSHVVTVRGKKYNSDVLAATELATRQCGGY
jgi:hypothetical protein